jgi:hypothetical protein
MLVASAALLLNGASGLAAPEVTEIIEPPWRAPEHREDLPAEPEPAEELPGFTHTDHWIPVALGFLTAPGTDTSGGGLRFGYLFTRWGWGAGATFASTALFSDDGVNDT